LKHFFAIIDAMKKEFSMKSEKKQKHLQRIQFTHIFQTLFLLGGAVSMVANLLFAEDTMSLALSSKVFTHRGDIPSKYTCEGDDIAPPLHFEGVPENARSLVLIVDDPDAPDPNAPKMTWVHWVLYNIPSDTTGLPAGAAFSDLPPGTQEGINDWGRTGYGGPCPPVGRHRYFFKLYALDTLLKLKGRPTKAEIEAAIKGHIVEKYELIGLYRKKN
jgi:Raf kinase inhibitor-like YbhB/YbcL family protein